MQHDFSKLDLGSVSCMADDSQLLSGELRDPEPECAVASPQAAMGQGRMNMSAQGNCEAEKQEALTS